MPAFADRGATVNRLRIRCRMDPVTARSRASWLLEESALQPATLPPSAILCIRRLADPRPGLIALNGAQLPPRAWTDAVAASVAAMARGAGRPGRGDTTVGAEAVVFADRADMLACLAADWCAGRLTALWWWRALLDDVGDARAVLRAWLKMPEYIAASIDELARRGGATTFVERLSATDTHALLDAIVVQHGLKWLASALEPLNRPDRSQPDMPAGERARDALARSENGAPLLERIPRAPWAGWVPESQPLTLRADQQWLLGVALMTRRAPTVARSARFATDVQRWRIDMTRVERTSPIAADATSAGSRDHDPVDRGAAVKSLQDGSESVADHANDLDRAASPPAQTPRAGAQTINTIESPSDGGPVAQLTSPEIHAPGPGAGGDLGRPASRDHAPPRQPGDRGGIATRLVGSAPRPVAAQPIDPLAVTGISVEAKAPAHLARACPASIDTEVGGVFYLLNVGLALGLYGDFTTPLQPGIDLSIWDFLTLAGQRLTPAHVRGDALWSLLANFAGRTPNDAAGATFDPPDNWRIPAEWLKAFRDSRTWRSSESSDRLRIVHPAGFVVVDVPRAAGEEAAAQAESEMSSYGATAAFVAKQDERIDEGRKRGKRGTAAYGGTGGAAGEPARLGQWMRWLIPYLRARLALALGDADRRRAGALVCVQRSRVLTSSTHVDVMFSLAELPIELRLSGLDRDPGWIPAADRVIAFHYE